MSYIGQEPVVGRYIKVDQISGGFNGTASGFTLTAGGQGVLPGTARNLMLSLGGVIQEPGVDFIISGSGLTFTTPPVAGTTFFCVVFGDMQAIGQPSDGTVIPASIASSGTFAFPNVTVTGTTATTNLKNPSSGSNNITLGTDGSTRISTLADSAGANTSTPAEIASGRAKAWVNFNGTGTVAIRASYNVSSITDNGVGDYTVNFTTALVDANYSAVATISPVYAPTNASPTVTLFSDGSNGEIAPTASAVRVQCEFPTTNINYDVKYFCVAIFR